jgi:hemophore-related protein
MLLEGVQMAHASSRKLVIAFGSLALSLSTGVGVASAEPDLGPILNTTCSYSQVMAALDAQSPELADEFSAQPAAESMLSTFLAAPLPVRQQIVQQVRGVVGPEYVEPIVQTADTCDDY